MLLPDVVQSATQFDAGGGKGYSGVFLNRPREEIYWPGFYRSAGDFYSASAFGSDWMS
jgi:hypothetical protein